MDDCLPMSDRSAHAAETNSRRFPWWAIGAVAIIFAFALFGDRGILHIFKQKNYQAELQQQLTEIEGTNAKLRQEIAALRGDRHYLERMARSQLGMVGEDEVVYQFVGKDRSQTPAVPLATSAH